MYDEVWRLSNKLWIHELVAVPEQELVQLTIFPPDIVMLYAT